LGKWIPVAETNPSSLDANHDPYVLSRQIRNKLHKAVEEENVLNEQLLALQNRCQHGETLIVQAIQKAIQTYFEQVTKESQYSTTIATEINGTPPPYSLDTPLLTIVAIASQIPPEKEWEAFTNSEPSLLKQDHKPRDPATVTFPFSDNATTKPILEATLSRKSTLLKRSQSSFYVLTPSGFLLEYKDADPVQNPDPTMSLKLSDCELGNSPQRSGKTGFTLRGKNTGKSLGRTHEYSFRTDNMEQAMTWWSHIEKFVGGAPRDNILDPEESDEEKEISPIHPPTEQIQNTPAPAQPGQVPTAPTQVARQTQMVSETAPAQQPITTAPPVSVAPPATSTAAPAPTAAATQYTAPATATTAPTTTASATAVPTSICFD
jgi:hypothetical protein